MSINQDILMFTKKFQVIIYKQSLLLHYIIEITEEYYLKPN